MATCQCAHKFRTYVQCVWQHWIHYRKIAGRACTKVTYSTFGMFLISMSNSISSVHVKSGDAILSEDTTQSHSSLEP